MSETWKLELVEADESGWVWGIPGYGELHMCMCRGISARLGYTLTLDDGTELFTGTDFRASPRHAVDSEEAALALLGFLTLRPGDTDPDYFEHYQQEQLEWVHSSQCEALGADIALRCEELAY